MRPQKIRAAPSAKPSEKRAAISEAWIPWLLIGITCLSFGGVVTHDFGPIDDLDTIAQNPKLNPPNFAADRVLWHLTHEHMGLYVPVTYMVWGLLAKATWVPTPDENGVFVDPHVFHAASLLAHLGSVVMAYLLLRRLLGRAWPAAAGAMLFAIHPIQVEAVAWASGLKDVMSGAFTLTALYFYVRAAEKRTEDGDRTEDSGPRTEKKTQTSSTHSVLHSQSSVLSPQSYPWLGLISLLIAMLCKPSAMVAPVVAVALDYFILRRPIRLILLSIWPWVLVVLPLAVVARLAQPATGLMSPPIWERPIVAGASLAFYLWKLLVPMRFSFGYDWDPNAMVTQRWAWAIALVPPALGGLLIFFRRKVWLVASCAVAVGVLLPVLGFVPFLFQFYSTVADHYVYLAMLGPAMALSWAIAQVPPRRWRAAAASCCIGAAVLAAISIGQMRFWQTRESLLRRMIAISPRSLLGHNGLGKFYQSRRDFVRAEEQYRIASEINPQYAAARENLVNIYSYLGRADDAITQIHALMDIHSRWPARYRQDYSGVFFEIGQLTLSQGRITDAVRYLREAIRLHPENKDAHRLLRIALEKLSPATTNVGTRTETHKQ